MLFIDAREIYNLIDRTHRDWTPQQIEFLANIVRLWRGEKPEFDNGSNELLDKTLSDRAYADVLGLCSIATLGQIEEQDWSLNPGRYVGLSAHGSDDIEFASTMELLEEQFAALTAEAVALADSVQMTIGRAVRP